MCVTKANKIENQLMYHITQICLSVCEHVREEALPRYNQTTVSLLGQTQINSVWPEIQHNLTLNTLSRVIQ